MPIRLPPLRERLEDIPPLAQHFLRARAGATACRSKTLDPEAMDRLKQHRLAGQCARAGEPDAPPGRALPEETIGAEAIDAELAEAEPPRRAAGAATRAGDRWRSAVERHICRRFFAAHDGRPAAVPASTTGCIAEVERPLIALALAATRGNQIKAAAMLGLNRNTLRKKIRDLDIPVVRGLG